MGVDVQGKLRRALGSVKDHASIGKAMIYHHDGFSDLEVAVVRATGHDDSPIDDKYMHEILFLVSNSPSSITFLAERISRRLGKTRDRLVALKTLVLIHRLLRGGNRCFEQQLRGAHVSGHLRMTTGWFLMSNTEPSVCFLHRYAAYLQERMGWVINQAGKLEPVMSQALELQFYEEKLIHTVLRRLPRCQILLDRVLDCSPSEISPSDSLAQVAMSNTLKESFQVYMAFCEGVAALVNMFFELTRPVRALACNILRRASQQSQELHDLYEHCKTIIGNKNLEYPSVQIISIDHVLALEQLLSFTPTPYGSVLTTKAAGSKPPAILDYLTRSTKMQSTKTGTEGQGEKDDHTSESTLSPTLFSCTLETKISKVWVVFDEEESAESQVSIERLFIKGTVSNLSQ
ncbi:hypothetical protein VitviT2T_029312 [Vitis vinifera]|uniref:ENTH domain-containing protein n=2 Tax=Vitis vinifera TaxID=29760 RepID=A0ABY9DWP4_VITVI|nr:putative clathrin assembly protein At1g33340 [Vitis vinifera]WKA11857.1 hypothetical protein VitviT2T_029312 [Vitis vinifera]|eukprot:XP_002263734.1 PREDICTED: putative clathrin assembly protein At1g33340 [Vitis vinifera]